MLMLLNLELVMKTGLSDTYDYKRRKKWPLRQTLDIIDDRQK